MVIKSYAFENNKIGYGWEDWNKKYTESLKEEVFGENKKRNSCGKVYCDPDGGNMEYYTRICQFLNTQEKIISEDKRFQYCVEKYNRACRINVCKEGRIIFCLKTDQFGFSAPRAENASRPQNVVPQPFCKYYEKEEDKEKAITNIVKWIYITRSLGGAFIWPEVKGPSYNIYRGGSIPRDNRRYMQDRVDLALLEVLHFLSKNYEQYDKLYKTDMLHSQIKKENTHMKEWLEHFGSFEIFVTYFKFDDFVEKKDGVKSIIDGKKLNDKGRENCELPQDSEGLYKVLNRITDMIYKRTNKMEEILKGV